MTGGSPTGGTYSGPGVSNGVFNPAVAGAGTHTIIYSYNTNGCNTAASKTITVNPAPQLNITSTYVRFLSGKGGQLSVTGAESYSWSPTTGLSNANSSNPTVTLTNTGNSPVTYSYTVTGQNANGCSSTAVVEVIVDPVKLSVNTPKASSVSLVPTGTKTPPESPAVSSMNYVRTYTARVATTSEAELSSPTTPVEKVQVSTQYFDGLGRPLQTVIKQASPGKNDVIQPMVYDEFGRQKKEYLPYVGGATSLGSYRSNALQEQYQFYTQSSAYNESLPKTDYPYAEKDFEASPLNRVLAQAASGENWRLGSAHEVKYAEQTNTLSDAVRIWQVGSGLSTTLTSPATYGAGTLYVSQVTDEQGSKSYAYKDKQGRIILKKQQSSTSQYVSTYYVYDDLGNLRYVLPPKAVEVMAQNNWQLTANVHALVFRYHYDSRQRLIIKQVPGSEPIYLVYNKRDQLILTQDGNQRKPGVTPQWSFTKYDALNRPIMTGIFSDSRTHEQMQAQAASTTNQYEATTANETGYTLTSSFPTSVAEKDLLTVTYYDNYNYPAMSGTSFVPEAGVTAKNNKVKGQVTGEKVRDLGTNTWLLTVNFYDDKYRIIQTVSQNNFWGSDRTTTQYDFTGNPLVAYTTHTLGIATLILKDEMSYDHAGRLLQTRQRISTDAGWIDAFPALILSSNEYNELGQLKDKSLHSADGGSSYLQSVDYRYNIRGWLTHINNSSLSNDNGLTNDDSNDVFGMELSYDFGFNKNYFNGNIAGVKWQVSTDKVQRSYGYQYDPFSRILQGDFRAYNASNGQWDKEQTSGNGNYDMWGLSYDVNGNILSMNRRGLRSGTSTTKAYGLLDQLQYRYEPAKGNQLLGVDDTEVTASTHDFEDKGGRKYSMASPEYAYDANGNMIRDDNKGITNVTYNHLNLPAVIEFGTGKGIHYQYKADGTKMSKTVVESGKPNAVTNYVSNMVLDGEVLQYIHTPEGRIKINQAQMEWTYEYHIKDHLGNLRVSFGEPITNNMMATMEEVNDYQEQEVYGFENISETRHQDQVKARSGNYAARLNAEEGTLLGPGKQLQVQKGDSVHVQVFGHYRKEKKSNKAYSLATWLAGNSVMQVQDAPREKGGNKTKSAFPFLSAGIALTPQVLQNSKKAPQAYVRYIAYDSTGNYLGSEYQLLGEEAQDNWEELQLNYTAKDDGYVEVFVANESGQEVFFDDMSISTVSPPVVQENHYDPWGLNLAGIEKQGVPDHKFQYQGKEKQGDLGLNTYDFHTRMYMPDIGRTFQVDPMSDSYYSWSPYAWVMSNPIKFMDPTGMFSTHTDKDGNVVAVYDDGDLSVYKHDDTPKEFAKNDKEAANGEKRLSGKDGERMGRTLHTYSFVDFDKFEEGDVSPVGRIDFGANWAQTNVQNVLDENSGVIDYGLNAGTGEAYDVKAHTPEGEGKYYGSIIYDDVYASARDVGNFAAGAVAQRSILPTKLILYGFGAYNNSNNSKRDTPLTIMYDQAIRSSGGNKGFLQAPTYGEDQLSFRGIQLGIQNSRRFR
ncbi:DUF6443 domain-containing protein [Pontibacter silvestris]|uniref:DUF6443 domain-containing protein n=1 Tax=Pontibacter silvestris TaxID=2305183 RepID=UPI001E3643A2|nr:DUF6443 domain-containing protein [Pontibacter silvestris]MCC9138774.1 DUF6443 domain-containing protein [Pontibacter silvestris]